MIRIAMCDDNAKELERLKTKVERYVGHHFPQENVLYKTFESSVEIESSLQKTDIADIFILDVDMPEINGFKLAKIIRDKNAGAIIFFVTAHMEMADRGYQVQALRYISKMGGDQNLEKALVTAIKTYQKNQDRYIMITYDRNYYRIAISQILYVKMARRELNIYTRTQDAIRDARGLKELYNLLDDKRFVFIDRGTFVNADYVQKIERNEVILQDGSCFTISRRLVSDVKEAVAAYWSM